MFQDQKMGQSLAGSKQAGQADNSRNHITRQTKIQ